MFRSSPVPGTIKTSLGEPREANSGCYPDASSQFSYWGYPGGEDLADYHEEDPVLNGTSNLLPLAEDSDEAFDASVFVNLGVEYQATDRLSFNAGGSNVLGLFDHKFNKRNQFQRTSQYRLEAPAFGMSVRFELP